MLDSKKYNLWNFLKQKLNFGTQKEFFVKERQVWFLHNGANIGFESSGKGEDFKRPVLVLKKVGNLFFVASMSTKGKDTKFYYRLDKSYFGKNSFVLLSQVKVVDKKRFFEEIGKISGKNFRGIQKKLKDLLF